VLLTIEQQSLPMHLGNDTMEIIIFSVLAVIMIVTILLGATGFFFLVLEDNMSEILKFVRQWRLFTLGGICFMAYLTLQVTKWFMGIPTPNNSQGAFASAVVLAGVGAIKWWMETRASTHSDTDKEET